MSARDSRLPNRALEETLRSFDAQLRKLERRMVRWPGAAVSARDDTPSQFTPGINLAYNWHDVLTITVGRGVWFVIANASMSSEDGAESRHWSAIRINGSDDASAENRQIYFGLPTPEARSSLTSYSKLTVSDASATITLQVSYSTNRVALPDPSQYPTLESASIIARPN